MAILTSEDYREIRKFLYQKGLGKELLKLLPNIPNKTQQLAIFQAVEDRMVAAALLARSDIETILGQQLGVDAQTRNDTLRAIIRAWMRWRDRHGG